MSEDAMKTTFLRMLFVILAALCICATLGRAQTVTGTVTGIITDATGAVIPGATVVARNLDTGVTSSATSDSAGLYRIAYLPIGRYTETINASGFGEKTVPEFRLEALQTITFNVTLTPGNVSTTVKVSAAAPILNTNDPTLGSTITSNTIRNFPLNGLDFSALTLYVPGSVSTAGTSGTTVIERSTYYTDSINLNGNRAQANNYTLDGIDINETFNNLISYSPAPEALQEVRVLSANAPADYGNVNGGGVVAILKSGTNSFHGSAYGYVQDYKLNANSWSNNHAVPIIPVNPYSQAQFGGALGGPIIRNKLFFFVDYLGSRYHKGGIGQASVFTQPMRNGDFSALLCQGPNASSSCNPIQLYDPENGNAPYVNDQGVPIVNPVAQFLFANPSLYPLPNSTPSDGIAANNYQAPSRQFKANNQGDIKIEYDPKASDKITGFYAMSTAYDGTTPVLALTFPGPNVYPTKVGGANWVHIFSPSIVNSARIGFTRTVWEQNFSVDTTGQFGTSGNAKVGIPFPNQAYAGFSFQNMGNSTITGVGNPVYGGGLIDNTFSYIDDFTWQRGKHTLHFGIQALRYQNNYPTANNYGYLGSLVYSGNYTGNGSTAGYGGADFVLDRVSQAAATLASNNVGQRQWRIAGYASDDDKILPNLTLNFGVRYEFDQPWVEQNNKTGNIDIATGQVIYAHQVPAGAPVGSGLCSNSGCYDAQNEVMPRLGFAYQLKNRFVIRGGYGATSFFEGNSSNQRLTSITPFIEAVQTPTFAPPAPPRTAEEGFTGGTITPGGTYNVYPKDIKPAYVQEWNLTAEYAVTHTMSFQVGYLGEQGQHIEDYGNLNQWLVNGDQTSAPYYNNQYIGINAPIAGVGASPLLITESRAAMNYQALQAVLRERLSHGLEFTFNYTYAKSITNSLGNYALNVNGFSGAFQNYYDSAADWGPSGYDVRHNVSGTMVYALPFGRGQQFLSGINRWADEAIGGWRIAAVGVGYTGFPQTATTSVNNNSQSYGNARPNQYRKLKIVNRSVDNWFGTDPSAIPCTTPGVDNGVCAFGVPAPNSFGTARNGSLRGPGFLNVDMSALKDFHTYREQTLGFRFDAFNTFNIASYGNPDTGINDTDFGNISNQGSGAVRSVERHLQFSANYRF
jgi:hypothetical protein